MSFNDRCGEAMEILEHGGVLPDEETRAALRVILELGKDGMRFPSRTLVDAILEHPDNQELRRQVADGEWIGGGGETYREAVDALNPIWTSWSASDD